MNTDPKGAAAPANACAACGHPESAPSANVSGMELPR